MNLRSNPFARIFAILLVLSGCASTPSQLTEEKQNEIKTVAIVSLVPESVNFSKIGIISFANEYSTFDMGSRMTNSIVSVSQERIVRSHPNWVVKIIEYDRTALLAKVKSTIGFRSIDAEDAFANLANANDLDAIFVVRATSDEENNMREGLNVLLLNNYLDRNQRLSIRANASVGIINKKGKLIAVGQVPNKLNSYTTLNPEDYELKDKMKDNHRPEVLDKLGAEVIVDITRRINLCFDSLGF